ncbi:MAG: OFA family MFS transporter [Planctomycetes bacterium]|nr:OFA family MFS transporter [Planctomycetota bacterium]
MAADLAPPKGELKIINANITGESDKEKKATLVAQRTQIEERINQIVSTYVPAANLDKLRYAFNNKQTQAIFAVGLALFAIVMVLAGRIMPKIGPRKLAAAGGVVLGLGYILAGLAGGNSFWLHLIFIGGIGGAGIGLAYVVPIAVAMKWFPDKKGLVTGLAVAGFGFGALGWIKMGDDWGHLIANFGLPTVFVTYGVAFLVAVVVGSIWMVDPPAGWKPAGWQPPAPNQGGKPAMGTVDFSSGEMLRTPQFYMIFSVFIFSAGAGLMTIGLMKAFPPRALVAKGIDSITAGAIASTAMGVCFALANGIGRIAWGWLSDKLGRKTSIIVMCAAQGVFMLLFTKLAGNEWLLYIAATCVGFNFGGNFALFPTITADTFGSKYLGQNYGWVFLAYGVGGVLLPLLGGYLGDLDKFPLAFTIAGVLCLVAAVIAAMITHPRKAEAPAAV